MPISDHYRGGMTERLLVRVITVDTSKPRIEVIGKDASVIQVSLVYNQPLFVWPHEGEFWTIVRENGAWSLESKVLEPDENFPVSPGDGQVLTEKIWTPSGDYLIRHSEFQALE